jgi:hypothetical protein
LTGGDSKAPKKKAPIDLQSQSSGQRSAVERGIRQYVQAVFQYLRSSEACLVKGWPDRKKTIRIAFRIQELANQIDELRFESLLAEHGSEDAIWASFQNVSSVWDRLREGWLSTEEAALRRDNRAYDVLAAEYEDLRRSLDIRALDGPLRDAQQDGEYRQALHAMQNRLRELDQELLASGTRPDRPE